jgi:hypothetical protein
MKSKSNNGGKKLSTKKKVTVQRKALVMEKGVMHVTSDTTTNEFKEKKRNSFSKRLQDIFNVQILDKDSSKGFKFMEGINREIKPAQVTLLAKSIGKMGILRPVIVADLYFNGLNGTYIIDGQHLFFALMRENLDIPYIKIEIKDAEELVERTALLNSSSKSWMLKDYVQVWSFIRPDYKKLSHYFNQYDLEMQTIASVLNNRNASSGGANSIIKNGTFVVKDESKAVRTLDYITDVLKCVPRMDRMSNKFFVGAYIEFLTQNATSYDHKKFCTYLKSHKQKLTFVNGDKENIFSFFNECL